MEINIKPEEIDKYVKEAIMTSSIGKIINEGATKYMNDILSRSWDSPIKHIVESIVRQKLEEILRQPENLSIIEKAIQDKFTSGYITDVIYAATERVNK